MWGPFFDFFCFIAEFLFPGNEKAYERRGTKNLMQTADKIGCLIWSAVILFVLCAAIAVLFFS